MTGSILHSPIGTMTGNPLVSVWPIAGAVAFGTSVAGFVLTLTAPSEVVAWLGGFGVAAFAVFEMLIRAAAWRGEVLGSGAYVVPAAFAFAAMLNGAPSVWKDVWARCLSLAMFAVAGAGFFATFLELTEFGRTVAVATGAETMLGLFRVPGVSLWACAAFGSSVLGTVMTMTRTSTSLLALLAGIGATAVVLVAVAMRLGVPVLTGIAGSPPPTIVYGVGFYAALAGLAGAAVVNAKRRSAAHDQRGETIERTP